jgi:tetratricopeptide (TPR) repeat protein
MTVAARRMASLLGVLPDGAAEGDLAALLPNQGPAAARVLAQMALAYFDGGRLLMLAPIREHVAQAHPVGVRDLNHVMVFYAGLAAKLGDKPGRPGGKDALDRLTPEAANLDAMIRIGLDGQRAEVWTDVALTLGQYTRFSMRPYPCPIEHALQVTRILGEALCEARCVQGLGDLALRRSDLTSARERYAEALTLYRQLGDAQREANCLRSLGDLALRQLDDEEARRRYDEALPIFQRIGDVLGKANCIVSFATIALSRSQHNEAKLLYEDALPLFQQSGDLLGEANAIQGLGNVMFYCLMYEEARAFYEKAIAIHRVVGDLRGEANCLLLLGISAIYRHQPGEARARCERAIHLYAQIDEPCGSGMAHRALARLEDGATEKGDHVTAARHYWTSIDRVDLIAELDAEFPPAP